MKHCGRLAVTSLWHLRLLLLLLSWPVVATLLSKEIYQRWAIYPSAPEVICHHGGGHFIQRPDIWIDGLHTKLSSQIKSAEF